MLQLTSLDITIVLGATLGVVIIGLVAARRMAHTTEGYFLSSGRMPWWLIGAAFVSTSVSSEQIVGTVGAAYKWGLGIANWEWFGLPIYAMMLLFFIPIYLRNRIMTVPELLNRRFGPLCGDIYGFVMLFGYLFVFLPPVLYGGSRSYTLSGGLSSVMWTDAVQCAMLIGGGVVLFFIALNRIPGGWEAMTAAAPERFHLVLPADDPQAPMLGLIVASFGVFLFYSATNQVMIQRVLSARSTWDGLMGTVFASFLDFIRPLVTCLLGLIVYHWLDVMHRGPSLLPDHQDDAFPFALATFAPSGVRGVILAGFLAAVMSTVSALANSIATIFSLDVYRRFFRRSAGDAELIRTGRIAGALALLAASLIAPAIAHIGLFTFFQTGITYMATPFVSVILVGIFWRRATYTAAVTGLLGGIVIQVALALGLPACGLDLHWLYIGAIAEVLTILLVIAVSLRTTPPRPGQVETLVWRRELLNAYDENGRRPWWQQVGFWFGIYTVGMGILYWCLR